MINQGFLSSSQKRNCTVKRETCKKTWHTEKKAGKSISKIKSMLITFWRSRYHKELCFKDIKSVKFSTVKFLKKSEKGPFVSGQRLLTLGCSIWTKEHSWSTQAPLVHAIIFCFQNSIANFEAAILKYDTFFDKYVKHL